MKKFMLVMAAFATAALVISGIGLADPDATVRGIEPVLISGQVRCSDLSKQRDVGSQFVRFATPVNGASANGINLLLDNNFVVGWYVVNNAPAVRAVIVKGGSAVNVYFYPYPAENFSDGNLHAPTNPKNGKIATLGYVEFCYSPS